MTPEIQILEVVALIDDLPAKGLLRGQVGTVVERLATDAFEIEFSDDQGHTYAQFALHSRELLELHDQPQQAA